MRIIPLSEGSFTIDHTKRFIPFEQGKDNMVNRPAGSLLVEIQPFAIITEKDSILLDTGLGFLTAEGELQIHQNLMEAGIQPMDITKVLLSHLHKDHSAGAGYYNPITKERELSFPNATYYVQEKELEFALATGKPSYQIEDIEFLKNHEQVILLPEEGMIDGYIRFQESSGHSQHHQVFWIQDDGHIVFYGGDEAPQLQQLKSRFIAKYDHDGRKAMELRQNWMEMARKEGWDFLFYHDVKTPVFNPKNVQ
ncbi:MAG: MBL fold metallo-hydrolase [Chitinophagaceae bacterium]